MAKKEVENVEVKKEKPRELLKFEDFDSSKMVNASKSLRAFNCMIGKGKPQSSEIFLYNRGLVEGYKDQELFEYIYKGLGGMMDAKKAKINRENEAKAKKRRASR